MGINCEFVFNVKSCFEHILHSGVLLHLGHSHMTSRILAPVSSPCLIQAIIQTKVKPVLFNPQWRIHDLSNF